MTILETILILALIVTLAIAAIAVFFAVKFGMIILRVEDVVEDTLDVLDERYSSISEIVEIPLFSDSPQIKKVHQDLKYSRDAILSVAHVLIGEFNRTEIEETENGETP